MRDPSRAYTDDNIPAVICLAYNGLNVAAVEPAKSPSQAPLMSLQMVDHYGALNTVVMHAEGLAKLVAMLVACQSSKRRLSRHHIIVGLHNVQTLVAYMVLSH